jgi:hypothetical protein
VPALLALRDAVTFLRAGAGGAFAGGFKRTIAFGVSQTACVLRHFIHQGAGSRDRRTA